MKQLAFRSIPKVFEHYFPFNLKADKKVDLFLDVIAKNFRKTAGNFACFVAIVGTF